MRRGSEIFAWGALAALFLIVLALELPAPLRAATIEFLFVVAAYLLITFRFLFPRWNYLPRLVYATLLIDALIVGVLNLLLGEQISNFEFFFIPLILTSAVIADWRGTLFLAFFAAGVDFFIEPGMLLSNSSALANQILISGAFFFTALIAIGLVAHIRRRARESADATVRAAESERQSRADAEKSARQWQIINAVGLRVQQETGATPIFEMIGAELKALNLECLIALWDEPGKTLRVDYLSMAQTLQKYLERLAGISLRDFRIKIADLKEYQEMLATRRAQFAITSEDSLRRVHPTLSMPIIRQIFEMANAHRRIIAPLIANDQVIGVFRVWGNDLEENDVPAMTALAQHIAIALENARLYRDARRRLAQVTTLYEFSRAIAATLDPAELGARAIQALESFLAYQSGAILLVDADNR
ncbi:MAG: hypothetical protein HY257_12995, partial [Chloroflexi bacterium]|nr:hypothetical protein [Chloroflexota bacterium]